MIGAVVGSAVPDIVGSVTQTTVAVLIVGGLGLGLLALGVYGGVRGLQNYRHWRTLSTASPLTGTSATGDLASVTGTIAGPADGRSLESRYEGAHCVAYATEILDEQSANREDIYESAGGVIRDRSRTDEEAIPFVVQANAQEIHVEAPEANLVWSGIDFDSVSAGSVVRNVGTLRGLWVLFRSLARTSHKRRTYYEARLQPGDEISVVGTVRRRDEGVTLEAAPGAPLVVCSNPRHSIPRGYRGRAFSGFVGFALFGGVGGALLYFLADALVTGL